jgi:hypothetical protein
VVATGKLLESEGRITGVLVNTAMKEMVVEPAKSVLEGVAVGTLEYAGNLMERGMQGPASSTAPTPGLLSPQDYLAGMADPYASFVGPIPAAGLEGASGLGGDDALLPSTGPYTSGGSATPRTK